MPFMSNLLSLYVESRGRGWGGTDKLFKKEKEKVVDEIFSHVEIIKKRKNLGKFLKSYLSFKEELGTL